MAKKEVKNNKFNLVEENKMLALQLASLKADEKNVLDQTSSKLDEEKNNYVLEINKMAEENNLNFKKTSIDFDSQVETFDKNKQMIEILLDDLAKHSVFGSKK